MATKKKSRSPKEPTQETRPFSPFSLETTVIALPLLQKIKKDGPSKPQDVIIDINLEYPGGRDVAKTWTLNKIREITGSAEFETMNKAKNALSQQYLVGSLTGKQIQDLVRADSVDGRQAAGETPLRRAIYHVWPDFEIEPLISKSVRTVKGDAAHASFTALGEDIVWAVIDSGIDKSHPHFQRWKNLDVAPLEHRDFSGGMNSLVDDFGHGTHVAGILAGSATVSRKEGEPVIDRIRTVSWQRNEAGEITPRIDENLTAISGMAPKCKLLSLKVLGADGKGKASNLIAALAYIQDINGYGRRILIHGVNMSVGYGFEPKWFACGQSPLCVEVDKLVRSGVVVVAAAGNTGFGSIQPEAAGPASAGLGVTINDPGNAQLAITVGSTHRDMPHTYGVSYFSSKGPTGDGRLKPDVVAPGEKIISCGTGKKKQEAGRKIDAVTGGAGAALAGPGAEAGQVSPAEDMQIAEYLEDSGTSMAAPHVSGAIAGFLSVRREFIGQPERVKEIFVSTATDLKRERYFQGNGLIDLMRAIQSV